LHAYVSAARSQQQKVSLIRMTQHANSTSLGYIALYFIFNYI